jgi:putative ABC transport system permease protein
VLLTSAGVLMRSFIRLQGTQLGMQAANLLVLRAPLGTGRVETAAGQTRFVMQALARIRSAPGVIDAATTIGLPTFGGFATEFDVPGVDHTEKWRGVLELCSERYFRTLEVPLLQGRDFTSDDLDHNRPVAIVNRMFVERFLKQLDPIGRTVQLLLPPTAGARPAQPFQIVGVVENAKNNGVTDAIQPEAFVPQSARPLRGISFIVRTTGPPLRSLKAVKSEIWSVDPDVAISESDALEGYLMRFAYAAPRLGLAIFTAFAGMGLALVVLGVYSLIAYTVSCQIREIGIRIAVGAARWDVMRLTMGMAMRWLAIGSAIGLAASYATTRLVASELFEVSPTDPLTFATVVAVLASAGFAASSIPARRATRVDPIVVLRAE